LPGLIKLYETKPHDLYEVIAFHDASAKAFDALDEKLGPIRTRHWGGRELPFPVFLDASGTTIKAWDIRAFPTAIVIDPEGIVLRSHDAASAVEAILAETLKPWSESRPAPETKR
jgi:hypothetical protein